MFKKSTKILTFGITILLIVIGIMSTQKLLRGLNQNVSLTSGSEIFDFFNTL